MGKVETDLKFSRCAIRSVDDVTITTNSWPAPSFRSTKSRVHRRLPLANCPVPQQFSMKGKVVAFAVVICVVTQRLRDVITHHTTAANGKAHCESKVSLNIIKTCMTCDGFLSSSQTSSGMNTWSWTSLCRAQAPETCHARSGITWYSCTFVVTRPASCVAWN